MTKKQNEILQFLLNFKTASEEQIMELNECNTQDINYLLSNKLIVKDKQTNLIYHKLRGLDIKYKIALELICRYKNKLQSYSKAKFPVMISFIAENISYDIIVSKAIEQERIFEMLDEVSSSERIIIIIESEEMCDCTKIQTSRECLICKYPLEVIGKIN